MSKKENSLGYTQGMNYIAAVLSTVLEPEETFWTFHELLNRYHLNKLYADNLSNLPFLTFLTNCFIKNHLTSLYNHLVSQLTYH